MWVRARLSDSRRRKIAVQGAGRKTTIILRRISPQKINLVQTVERVYLFARKLTRYFFFYSRIFIFDKKKRVQNDLCQFTRISPGLFLNVSCFRCKKRFCAGQNSRKNLWPASAVDQFWHAAVAGTMHDTRVMSHDACRRVSWKRCIPHNLIFTWYNICSTYVYICNIYIFLYNIYFNVYFWKNTY